MQRLIFPSKTFSEAGRNKKCSHLNLPVEGNEMKSMLPNRLLLSITKSTAGISADISRSFLISLSAHRNLTNKQPIHLRILLVHGTKITNFLIFIHFICHRECTLGFKAPKVDELKTWSPILWRCWMGFYKKSSGFQYKTNYINVYPYLKMLSS